MADQASLALQNAGDAFHLAQKALDDTLTIADLSDEVSKWKDVARSAVRDAASAIDVARESYPVLYAVGYAPYWNAPTVVNLAGGRTWFANDGAEAYGSGIWTWGGYQDYSGNRPGPLKNLPLEGLVNDPAGGSVVFEPSCDNPSDGWWYPDEHSAACPIGTLPLIRGDKFEPCQWVLITWNRNINSGLIYFEIPRKVEFAGKVFPASFVVKSTKSGLKTLVTLQLLCYDGRNIADSYIQDARVIKSGYKSPLDDVKDREINKSLGWNSNRLVTSKSTGGLTLKRDVSR
ncbi:hypothetical protein P12x_006172 (plasmid) [Tundrisphaera lichenicola]|uniref:hypothetical protein n=1 Tax=Tundrisphaera lichenicola TaxID=2029860 RepID=UPI003EBA4BAC